MKYGNQSPLDLALFIGYENQHDLCCCSYSFGLFICVYSSTYFLVAHLHLSFFVFVFSSRLKMDGKDQLEGVNQEG